MENDSQLLLTFLTNRNENAFRSLVERHADWCYGIALRLVNNNTHLAEEVCQTAFTRLAQNASKLRHRKTVGGWLYYSVKYIAANKIRSEMRRKTNEEAYAMQTESETQETSIDRRVVDTLDLRLDPGDQRASLTVTAKRPCAARR